VEVRIGGFNFKSDQIYFWPFLPNSPFSNFLEDKELHTRTYMDDELELDAGDTCTLHSGKNSVCKERKDCPTLSEKNVNNNLCSEDGELVCCPQEDDRMNCNENSITKKLEQSLL
jgi:hypothetical protein